MKSKYHLALKFFNETKNSDQLDICYKEIEVFLDTFGEFKFYIELDLRRLDPKLEAQMDYEERELLKNQDFLRIFNDYRLRSCEEVFTNNNNYNFELFRYALDKVFEEERKIKEKEDAKNKELNPSKGWSYGYIISIVFFLAIVGMIGLNYSSIIM